MHPGPTRPGAPSRRSTLPRMGIWERRCSCRKGFGWWGSSVTRIGSCPCTLWFRLFRQRLLSVLFGVLALLSWFVIVLRLSGRYSVAFIACLAVGFERNFLNAAASGRMDMMAAALGASAIAAFLQLRRRSMRAALVVSHSLAAASI